jgi:transcriptional regulator GlxA family with amidase domain
MRRGFDLFAKDETGLVPAERWLGERHVPRGTFPVGAPVRQPSEQCRRIVHEVEEIARSFAGKRLSLSDIYKEASVGPGMIRFAFRVVHGRPPRRFFHDERLQAVRADLGRAPAGLTVTQIAMSHGFVELGRFAAQYRAAFGENPSATLRLARLRSAIRSTGAMPASNTGA